MLLVHGAEPILACAAPVAGEAHAGLRFDRRFCVAVKAMMRPGLFGSLACAEPGPWQDSQAAAAPVPAAPARNACTCSECDACMFSSAWQATQDLAPIAIASGASGFFAMGAASNGVAGPLSSQAWTRGCAFASASVRMSVRGNIRLKSSVVNALAGNDTACGSVRAGSVLAWATSLGRIRWKSCSVRALREMTGWTTCAAALFASSNAPPNASRASSAAVGAAALRSARSGEGAMVGTDGMHGRR